MANPTAPPTIHPGDADRHANREVAPGGAQGHGDAAGQVLAGMVANPFHHRGDPELRTPKRSPATVDVIAGAQRMLA
nr:hypothetical protein [uncultured Lamprocystis sp.]